MSVKVLVNKGFYINKDGEKIELNQNSLDIYFKEDFDKLESENRILKAKIEKALASLKVLANIGETIKLRYEPTWYEDLAAETIKELDSIGE